jgi:TatD DNase family protein
MANLFFTKDILFDSHAHLCDESFEKDRAEAVQRARKIGVEKIVDISVDMSTARRAIANAKAYLGIVYASVGVDMECLVPGSDIFKKEVFSLQDTEWNKYLESIREGIDNLVATDRESVVSIGETGLDTYWLSNGKNLSSIEKDRSRKRREELLITHLEVAKKYSLPISLHSRGAEEICLEIVRRYEGVRGVFHSYTGDYDTAKKVLDIGWGLGVNGIVTFSKATGLREMYRKILGIGSKDRDISDYYDCGIYFETDAPYLSPEGKRGERNESANLHNIYSKFREILQ